MPSLEKRRMRTSPRWRKKEAVPPPAMPAVLLDYCKTNGYPTNLQWHPKYNALGVSPTISEQELECICFGRDWPSELGGLGAWRHFRRFVELTWPHIEWNPWLERTTKSLCDPEWEHKEGGTRVRFVSWVGCGSASKTFSAGLFAGAWWLFDLVCGTRKSSVTLTSTSKGIIAQRVWPVIQMLFHEAKVASTGERWIWGRMIDSMKIVEPLSASGDGRRDSKHTICAVAVESGELQASLDKIKGRHTERMLLIVDEANSTPQAIFECVPNMLTSARELIVLVIGNPEKRLDFHGRCCEPLKGWKSISTEDDIWPTKGVPQWGIGQGVCLRFDGAKSPNVVAGRTIHKHIYSFERWQQVERTSSDYRNTPRHWSQDRGFWAPDSLSNTVFSEAMVLSHDGLGNFTWLSEPVPCASCDPAFGGDDCIFQLGWIGLIMPNRYGLLLRPPQLVPFDPDSTEPIDKQIADWIVAKCRAEGVSPRLFGLDSTGTGRGVAAFLKSSWSSQIVAVEFGGSVTDRPASVADGRPSHEVYGNRVTELWWSARELLEGDQLKGLSIEAVYEFCGRRYDFMARKYRIEPKEEMKVRLGKSPDRADAVVTLCEVARVNGGLSPEGASEKVSRQSSRDWREFVEQVDAVESVAYKESNPYEMTVGLD